ncbi:MAG: hypothetical protein GY716_08490 [bacterium]|nr:hypothetical protein [bacterium]
MREDAVLRPDEVEGVLSGGPAPVESGPQPYSLRDPIAIPPDKQDAARDVLEGIVSALSDELPAGSAIELQLDNLQQLTGAAALSILPSPVWMAGLARPEGGGFALALHPIVGQALVELALGGGGGQGEDDREPTPLESRVLSRMFEAAAPGISTLCSSTLASVESTVGSIPSEIAVPGETLAIGLLRFRIDEADHASLLLATPALLLPDDDAQQGERTTGPGPLADRLEQLTLKARPVLRAGTLRLHDLLALEAGKVVRLDASEDSLLELCVSGRPVARGRIACRGDQTIFTVEAPEGTDLAGPEGS